MTRYPKAGAGMRWTTRELQALVASWKGDTLSDGGGLSGEVRVSREGKVSVRFKYAYRWEGKVRWHQCGTWPSVELVEIRRNRDIARQEVSEGIDPTVAKESAKLDKKRAVEASLALAKVELQQRLTVDDLFKVWLEQGVNRSDDNKELERNYTQYILPHIGRIEIRHLTETHIRTLLKPVIAAGTVRKAQIMLLCLKQALKWGEQRKPWRPLLLEGNPADLVTEDSITPPDYQEQRKRRLSAGEIRELYRTLKTSTHFYENAQPGERLTTPRPLKLETQLAIWISLGTLCRVGELLMSRWEHVNFEDATWFIPEENVKGTRKNRSDLLVHLSPFVLDKFLELHRLTGKTEWCFPASNRSRTTTNGHVCIKSVSKQIGDRQAMFMKRTQPLKNRRNDNSLVLSQGRNGNWTFHDLRRTGVTMMQRLGIDLNTIDRCQNHSLTGSPIRRHYMLYEYFEEKTVAWTKLCEELEKILLSETEKCRP